MGSAGKIGGATHLLLNGLTMTSTITAGSTAAHVAAIAAPPPRAPAAPKATSAPATTHTSATSTAGSTAQRQAALNRMLVTYARDQSHGMDAATLSSLGKQILAAAKALGQRVTLPHAAASASASAASETSAASAASTKGKVDVTA
jgi:hypothetical protein